MHCLSKLTRTLEQQPDNNERKETYNALIKDILASLCILELIGQCLNQHLEQLVFGLADWVFDEEIVAIDPGLPNNGVRLDGGCERIYVGRGRWAEVRALPFTELQASEFTESLLQPILKLL